MAAWLKEHEISGKKGHLLYLYVQPGARKTQVKGTFQGDPPRLKISIQAPPVDNAANEAVVEWLCKILKISQSKVSILKGERSRQKNIWIEGMSSTLILDSLL